LRRDEQQTPNQRRSTLKPALLEFAHFRLRRDEQQTPNQRRSTLKPALLEFAHA